jgi:hypothetical protein
MSKGTVAAEEKEITLVDELASRSLCQRVRGLTFSIAARRRVISASLAWTFGLRTGISGRRRLGELGRRSFFGGSGAKTATLAERN